MKVARSVLVMLAMVGFIGSAYAQTTETSDSSEVMSTESTQTDRADDAQDSAESEPEPVPPFRVDEEMVVTAQKREQSITDIGITINALSSDDMRELNIKEAQDIAVTTPGLVASNTTGTPVFAIRAVGLDDYHPNNTSGVGTYVDEVSISSAAMLEFQLFDVDRVEVLKGPQGTLYGRNTTGGAINYISRKPTEEHEAYVELGYGRWEAVDTTLAVSGPLSDNTGYRVAATYVNQGEGFQEDVSNGTEGGQPDKLAYRGLFSWESDKASLLLNLHGGRDRGNISGWQADDTFGLGPIFEPVFGFPMASPGEPDRIATGNGFTSIGGPVDSRQEMDDVGANINLAINLGNKTLTSITAWDTSERQRWENVDGSAWAINDDATYSDITQISQELRLAGGSGDFNWVGGLFFFNQEVDGNQIALITNTIDVVFADLGVPFEFWPSALGLPSTVGSVYTQDTDSIGIFGQADWPIAEKLRLTLGLRYSQEDVAYQGTVQDNEGFFTGTFVPTVLAALDDSQEDSRVSGRVNLDYQPHDDLLVYGSVSTGFKSGVYFSNPVPDAVGWGWAEPEELTAAEVGFKKTASNRGLQFNGSLFFYDYENKQVLTDVNFPGGVAPTLWNVPKSEVMGVEADLVWAPIAGLDIRAGAAWLDSEVKEAPTEIRGFPYDQIQEGDVLSWSPEWTYNAAIRRFVTVGSNHWITLQADYSFRDELQPIVGVGPDDVSFIDELVQLGMRFGFGPNDGRWETALWGRNINDGDAVTYVYTNFLSDRSYSLQKPASWGTTFIVRW